ncbi:hypothetical protein C3B60_16165 [Cryobacterium zongtaii]|nr:hypothetical protein C3B60_16165 [Cryobacterium zongtaii]
MLNGEALAVGFADLADEGLGLSDAVSTAEVAVGAGAEHPASIRTVAVMPMIRSFMIPPV